MDYPMVVMFRDRLAGPSNLHAIDPAHQQSDCGAWCVLWSKRRLLLDASEPFLGPETTIQTTPAAFRQAIQTDMATVHMSESTSDLQRELGAQSDYVGPSETTTSLQSETTSLSIVPLIGNQPSDEPFVPIVTSPTWTSVSSLTTTTRLATPTVTTTSSALSALEGKNNGGDGLSTKTTIAIAVPVSVVGIALFAGLLFFFLKRRRQERQLVSTSNPSLVLAAPKREPSWGDFGSTPRDRASFGTLVQRPTAHSHTLTPDTQSLNRELHPPPSADSRNGTRGRFTEQVHSIYAPDGSPMALTAENMSHHGQHTPRSPAWPLSPFRDSTANNTDDAASVVSRLSDRPNTTQNRALDDMSSISSIDDNERRRNVQP
ncbi:hypothetical protein BDV26DRAFT_75190 [Aspergillus bertholletiae]|uniref:Mid2 domain-containing protein n=1 Tax=Aspergillus bertholletiae TaxID=1226010 RepID=A0A5N7ATN6_9EURO|nr:hypothetical protein BDV26DRAFT_75190 [Aspergillus bertholletiae]